MIPSKTPEDNSSQPDTSSLGNAADYSGPGSSLQSSAEDGERISAAIPIAPARDFLSDDMLTSMREEEYSMDGSDIRILERSAYLQGTLDLRRKINTMITSGELRVVKKAKLGNAMSPWCCYFCSHYLGNVSDPKFCPNCGSEILPL